MVTTAAGRVGAQSAPPTVPSGSPPTGSTANDRAFSIDVPGQMMHYEAETGNWTVDGKVTIAYRNGTATGDRLVYNPRTHRAVLSGHVTLQRGGQAYAAESADLETASRLFSITDFKGAVAPSELQNQVSQPVYLSGSRLDNTPRGEIEVHNGRVTTCDPPDYWIDAALISVIPGDRAEFRDAEIVLLHHRILKVSRLTFSLKESQRNRLLPEVGRNDIEGYFAKERLPVGLGAVGAGLLLLDVMSKKGIGKGFDDAYRALRGTGRVEFYQLREKDTGTEDLSGSLQDNRRIGDFSTTLNTNYSKNSYTHTSLYGAGQSNFNANLGINRSSANSSTNATLSLSDAISSFSSSKTLNGFLRQHFSLSRVLATDFNLTRQISSYTNQSAPGGAAAAPTPASGQNEYQVTITNSAPAVTTVVASDVHQPFGRSSLFFVERYPEITFTTSSSRVLPLHQLPTGQPLISASGPASLPSPRVPGGAVATPGVGPSSSAGTPAPEAAPLSSAGSAPAPTAVSIPPTAASHPPVTAAPGAETSASGTAAAGTPAAGTPASATPSTGTPAAGAIPAVMALRAPLPALPTPWFDRNPINFNLTLGHYREAPANTRLNRVDLSVDGAAPEHAVVRGLLLAGNGRFEQKMTSDGTAQYIFNVNSTLNHPFSRLSSFNSTYYRIQPIGYTPFQFDRSGVVNISNLGMDLGLGQQPGVITTVRNTGSLGYLSPLGGGASSSSYGGGPQSYGGYGGSGYGGGFGGASYGSASYGSYSGMPGGYGASAAGSSPAPPVLHIGLHTAFDYEADRRSLLGEQKWSPLNIDVMAFPARRVAFYASSTYMLSSIRSSFAGAGSPGTSLFSPIRGGMRWIGGNDRFLDTTFTYDTARRQMTTLQSHVLLPFGHLTSLEALIGYQKGYGAGSYDPYSGAFEQVLLTRDLNCFVANLYYSTNPRQISFSISIKAFPIQRILGVQKFGNLFSQGGGHTF